LATTQRRVTRRPTAELKRRIHDDVARDLGIAIVTGRHCPGDSLGGELENSQRLGVSRNAYREAIRILAAKGLVESRQKAGLLVNERARWNLLDPEVMDWILSDRADPAFRDQLFQLRMIVEPAAASLAALHRDADDLTALHRALTDMKESAPDSPEGEKADERFHAAILAAGRNEIVARLASIVAASVNFVAEYKREAHVTRDAWPDHRDLYQAIADGAPPEAQAAMTRLIANARADVEGDPARTRSATDQSPKVRRRA